jgi:hypothetical protein
VRSCPATCEHDDSTAKRRAPESLGTVAQSLSAMLELDGLAQEAADCGLDCQRALGLQRSARFHNLKCGGT